MKNEEFCPHCAAKEKVEPMAAYARLARKQQQLAKVVERLIASRIPYEAERGLSGSRLEASGAAVSAAAAPAYEAARTRDLEHLRLVANRIVGGTPTTQFTHCCLIGRRQPNGMVGWFCTGVLVHPRIVLTAGHCFIPTRAANIVALNASDQNDLGQAELIRIKQLTVHPRYRQTEHLSDISVALLQKPATTQAAPIATKAELSEAKRARLVGFGNSDIDSTRGFGLKREVEVDIVSMRRSPNEDLDADEVKLGYESDLELVAGGEGFDSCNGDSGGPAYIDVGGKFKVAALTSRATDGAVHACGDGGIYTRLDAHLDFIGEVAIGAGITDF